MTIKNPNQPSPSKVMFGSNDHETTTKWLEAVLLAKFVTPFVNLSNSFLTPRPIIADGQVFTGMETSPGSGESCVCSRSRGAVVQEVEMGIFVELLREEKKCCYLSELA